MKTTGGGSFDPRGEHLYFLACNAGNLKVAQTIHPHLLIAINELRGEGALESLETALDRGCKVFIDSGIFALAAEHARKHNMALPEAFALQPEQLDGFQKLWSRYIEVVERFGDRVWGYVELDLGGADVKRQTRAKLEALGLRPIPVYHPFSDGWDYFDELASQYDRICFGNLVQADMPSRIRFLATLWQRRQQYPRLWVHLLGYTPSEYCNAYPSNSADSSTWLSGLRWNGVNINVDGKPFSRLEQNMRYLSIVQGGDETNGHDKALMVAAYDAAHNERIWRQHLAAWEGLGCTLYPAQEPA